jgi:arylsulfatase A-like enzyme
VPCIARWPGKLPQGRVDERLGLSFDLSASILAAAGVQPPEGRKLDGIPILQQVAAGDAPQPRPLFWRARRAERTWRAVRDGNLKYLSRQDGEACRYRPRSP